MTVSEKQWLCRRDRQQMCQRDSSCVKEIDSGCVREIAAVSEKQQLCQRDRRLTTGVDWNEKWAVAMRCVSVYTSHMWLRL